jgi:class 3 adenylate cyclase
VLVQPASDATANAASDGNTEVSARMSMTGSEVVSTVDRVPFDGITWYTVAEFGAARAEAPIISFRRVLLFGAAAFVVVLAFVAVAWAREFMRPVRVISERLSPSAVARMMTQPTTEPLRIPDRSPIEFHRLAESFNATGRSLRQQQRQLEHARAERLDVLERMLPASVAQRIAKGDIDSLDEVPTATVVVVVVLGLGGLVEAGRGGDRGLLDELHAELDGIALDHGLDRIKVVGDSYFGACGHDRPYIDHAPRTVAFAEDVAAAVRGLARRSPAPLDTAIGINTGPVTVGMSGGTRLVYDVWGPTVTAAHAIARSARAGEIVVTRATKQRLPEQIELVAWTPVGAEPSGGGGAGADLWQVVAVPTSSDPLSGTAVVP